MNSVGLLNSSSTTSLNSSALLNGAGQKQVEQKLDSFLQSKGLSPSERATLKNELKTAFESALKNSSFPPDFQQLQDTLSDILKKHSLDANELLASMPNLPKKGVGRSIAHQATRKQPTLSLAATPATATIALLERESSSAMMNFVFDVN